MEKKELIDKLTNLKGALYLLYRNYSVIQKKIEYDRKYWKIGTEKSLREMTEADWEENSNLNVIRYTTKKLNYPYENGKFDVLRNFKEAYEINYIDLNNKIYNKFKWYKLLFGSIGKSGLKEYDDLYKLQKKDNKFDTSLFIWYRKGNIETLETELKIVNDIEKDPRNEINKELKLSKSKIVITKNLIIKEISDSKIRLEKAINYIKSLGYDSAFPRTISEAEEDNKMIKLLEDIKNNLTKEYDFISPSDYKNIDGIIYMLETGRADNVKEALNLYDQRQYAEMIVGAINTLNQTIAYRLSSLEESINRNFSTLFGKIDIANSQMQMINKRLGNLEELEKISSEKITQKITEVEKNINRINYNSEEIRREIVGI